MLLTSEVQNQGGERGQEGRHVGAVRAEEEKSLYNKAEVYSLEENTGTNPLVHLFFFYLGPRTRCLRPILIFKFY